MELDINLNDYDILIDKVIEFNSNEELENSHIYKRCYFMWYNHRDDSFYFEMRWIAPECWYTSSIERLDLLNWKFNLL